MKKLLLFMLIMSIFIVPVSAADYLFIYEYSDFTVYVDDEPVEMDVEPIIVEGRMLVPLRSIMESLDCYVEWLPEYRCVQMASNDWLLSMYIEDTTAIFDDIDNSWTYEMDVPPIIINGRTMVPLRFISEALGYSVIYDERGWVDIYTY